MIVLAFTTQLLYYCILPLDKYTYESWNVVVTMISAAFFKYLFKIRIEPHTRQHFWTKITCGSECSLELTDYSFLMGYIWTHIRIDWSLIKASRIDWTPVAHKNWLIGWSLIGWSRHLEGEAAIRLCCASCEDETGSWQRGALPGWIEMEWLLD